MAPFSFLTPLFLTNLNNVELRIEFEMFVGMTAHVMTFEVGAVLEDEKWQAPFYCFNGTQGIDTDSPLLESTDRGGSLGKLMRGTSTAVK